MDAPFTSASPAHSILEAGGWVLLTIFLVSGWAWLVLASKWLELRRPTWRDRGGMTHRALDLLRGGAIDEARSLVRESSALGARAIRIAIGPGESAPAAAESLVRAEGATLRRQLDFVSTLGSTLPLLGLFGTVLGMLETFGVLSSGTRGVEVGSLAHGISRALVTTQAGLVTAVPVVLAHRWLASRVESLLTGVEGVLRDVAASLEGRGSLAETSGSTS